MRRNETGKINPAGSSPYNGLSIRIRDAHVVDPEFLRGGNIHVDMEPSEFIPIGHDIGMLKIYKYSLSSAEPDFMYTGRNQAFGLNERILVRYIPETFEIQLAFGIKSFLRR